MASPLFYNRFKIRYGFEKKSNIFQCKIPTILKWPPLHEVFMLFQNSQKSTELQNTADKLLFSLFQEHRIMCRYLYTISETKWLLVCIFGFIGMLICWITLLTAFLFGSCKKSASKMHRHRERRKWNCFEIYKLYSLDVYVICLSLLFMVKICKHCIAHRQTATFCPDIKYSRGSFHCSFTSSGY